VKFFFLPYLNKNYKKFGISLTLAGYPALPDIRQGNLVSGQIPDIRKGRIIRRIPNIKNILHYIIKVIDQRAF
jgi:hypothetical protein